MVSRTELVRLHEPHLFIVSNRVPLLHEAKAELEGLGEGGLVNVLAGLARRFETTWIGNDRRLERGEREVVGDNRHVVLDPTTHELFYTVVSNDTLWMVQHGCMQWDGHDASKLASAWEDGYVEANRAFAEVVCGALRDRPGAVVLFNDYHLYLAPSMVREAMPDAMLAFYLHIPWADVEQWRKLPADIVQQIHRGLLACDLVGFQTAVWRERFARSASHFLDATTRGRNVVYAGREVRCVDRPVSIDVAFLDAVRTHVDVQGWRRLLRDRCPELMVLRVERSDPAKNTLVGLESFAQYLRTHPHMIGKVRLVLLLCPSRQDSFAYRALMVAIGDAVERTNRLFGRAGWRPVELFVGDCLARSIAGYLEYDVLMVTPVSDGMNLVAKEGPFLNGRDGVLVLSTDAGAFQELGKFAVAVEPSGVESHVEALATALSMAPHERRQRAVGMRDHLESHALSQWADGFGDDMLSR